MTVVKSNVSDCIKQCIEEFSINMQIVLYCILLIDSIKQKRGDRTCLNTGDVISVYSEVMKRVNITPKTEVNRILRMKRITPLTNRSIYSNIKEFEQYKFLTTTVVCLGRYGRTTKICLSSDKNIISSLIMSIPVIKENNLDDLNADWVKNISILNYPNWINKVHLIE